jgi:hypothetical protein
MGPQRRRSAEDAVIGPRLKVHQEPVSLSLRCIHGLWTLSNHLEPLDSHFVYQGTQQAAKTCDDVCVAHFLVQPRFAARVVAAIRPCRGPLRLWTKSNLRAAEPQGAAVVSAAESRRARVVAGFTAKLWEVRNGRSRALFEQQPKPTMQPVVAPGLTNEYSVGSYNSRMKVVAELDARGVAYDNKDPFRSTEEGVVSLVQRLKALPDVFKSTVDGKLHLKRKGPNWDDPETDGDAAELELLETTMAGRGV